MVHMCAISEEYAIEQWNDAIAHEFDLEYLDELPKLDMRNLEIIMV